MDHEFKTDGCSGGFMCFLRLVWKVRYKLGLESTPVPPWEEDCVAHDAEYFPGGTVRDKIDADVRLMQRIAERGYPRLARMMFLGVSLGGVWFLPLPWRWGYGWKYPRRYQEREATGRAWFAEYCK